MIYHDMPKVLKVDINLEHDTLCACVCVIERGIIALNSNYESFLQKKTHKKQKICTGSLCKKRFKLDVLGFFLHR